MHAARVPRHQVGLRHVVADTTCLFRAIISLGLAYRPIFRRPDRSPEVGVACVGLSGVGGEAALWGLIRRALCAVQAWASAFIYLSIYLSI